MSLTCLMWGRSGVLMRGFGTSAFHQECTNWSFLSLSGLFFSFHTSLKPSNTRPFIMSSGPKSRVVLLWQLLYLQYSLSIRNMGKLESKSTRSFNSSLKAGKLLHGSWPLTCLPLLLSIPFMSSSRQARFLFWTLLLFGFCVLTSQKPIFVEIGFTVCVLPKAAQNIQ